MAAPGSCGICSSRHRNQIGEAHTREVPVRQIARSFGVPESSLRRHFRGCAWRPTKTPKPAPRVEVVCITRQHLEAVAAEFDLEFKEMLFHEIHCRGGNVAVASAAERDELVELMRTHATAEEFQEMFGAGADRGAIVVLA